MEENEFKPYIPAEKVMPELSVFSIIVGAILAVVFGAANAYLGLRVGTSVSASIPAAVISMGILRVVLRRNSILENNMVQTIGSAGESLATGMIFTIPAIFMWATEGIGEYPTALNIGILSLLGGFLGVFMMLPLRKALIVREHGKLEYPEGKACAEVLIAGENKSAKAGTVFAGLGISAAYKFIADGIKLIPSKIDIKINSLKGFALGADTLPALVGVGYICGFDVSAALFSGGLVAWCVLMPLMLFFGGNSVIFPAEVSVAKLFEAQGSSGLWSNYIRYIGAGALVTGGIISMIKSIPMIVSAFGSAVREYGKGGKSNLLRTDKDISMKFSLIGSLVICVVIWLYPGIPVNLLGSFVILIFGFIFACVASRIVGTVGSTNNPVSGMTIATLLIATALLRASGETGAAGMTGAISIGAIICTITAMAGDMSQDLKTGFLVGATPKKQQYGEMIGVAVTAVAVGAIIYLLNSAWGFGSEELPAPQATMMKMVVEGVMTGNLPWTLIFIGAFIAVAAFLLGIPVLSFAIGLYLPIHTTAAMMAGGIIRLIVDKCKYKSDDAKKNAVENGVLYSSGLIAGEGLIGILLAVFAVAKINGRAIEDIIDISWTFNFGPIGGAVAFLLVALSVGYFVRKGAKKS